MNENCHHWGGPAGLYFAILMKLADPTHTITLYERNRPHDTFGWGVVFSDQTLENLKGGDEVTQNEIISGLAHWDEIDVLFKGTTITSGGHGSAASSAGTPEHPATAGGVARR